MTLVLHTYTDIRKKDQVETLAELGLIEAGYGDKLKSYKCVEPDDYWSFLLRNWGREDIVIVEQDIVATIGAIDHLAMCQRKVCAFPYVLAAGQLSVFDILPSVNVREPFHEYPTIHPPIVPKESDGTSLGFTKLCVCIQTKIPLHQYPVERYEWWYLDSFISWHLKRLHEKVHVHQQLAQHNRTVEVTFQIGDQSVTLSNDTES